MLTNAASQSSPIQAPSRWPPDVAVLGVCDCGGFARRGVCKDPLGHEARVARKATVPAQTDLQGGLRVGFIVLRLPWRRRRQQ